MPAIELIRTARSGVVVLVVVLVVSVDEQEECSHSFWQCCD
jgi:hypothetical protein